MRILYFSTPPFADCDFPLVREFQRRGHEVFYFIDLPPYFLRSTIIDIKHQIQTNEIFLASKYKEFEVYRDYMSLENVYVINRTQKSALHPRNIALYLKFIKIVNKINPDIINVVGGINELSSFLLKFKRKLVLTVHDPFPHTGEQSLRREFFRKLAMRNIPRFILLNEKQKGEFIKRYKLRSEQVFNSRLGVYDCIHNFIKKVDDQAQPIKNILFFGRISPYKGVEYLLEAMKLVHQKIPDATLTIAGGGKIYFDLAPYQNLPYIEIRNHYIGMEELAELIARTQIVVCPYTDATQSGVIMTAYSLCKPVIATAVGGLVEMVDDGKSGLLVPPKNVEALASSICMLLSKYDRLISMETFIRHRYYEGEYSWGNITRDYINVYSL